MRINCPKGRGDLNKILNGIKTFEIEHYGIKPSYIIMNYKTGNDILDFYYLNSIIKDISTKGGKLFGISVAYNEELEYGEVDVV